MKNKIRLILCTTFLFVICFCGYSFAEESNTLVAGTDYSLTIPALSHKAYLFYPEYTGAYDITAVTDSNFECDILNYSYSDRFSSSFNINQTFNEMEVCCFSFSNTNNYDIVISLSIYPDFLPEIYTEANGISIRKGKTATLNLNAPNIVKEMTWTSSDASIATVDDNGVIKGISEGSAIITASGTTISNQMFSDSYTVYISNPKLSLKNISLNVYGLSNEYGCYYPENNYIEIKGINPYSSIEIKYPEKKLSVTGIWDNDQTFLTDYIYPKKRGKSTITFIIDGKKLTCTVNVFRAYFVRNPKTVGDSFSKKWIENSSTLALYKGEKTTLKTKGFKSDSIKWSSSNKKVARVNKKGIVTAKGYGSTIITAKVGTSKITYLVNVSYKKAVKAIRYANKNHGASYSQAKRMQKGFYDCSSYAWRSYNSAGMNVGPLPEWAPTAADMAAWCTDNNYMIASGIVDTSDLLPGDLIFLCGENNGRYNGIYHVDLYHGNYSSITVEDVYHCAPYMYNVMVARPCAKNTISIKNISPALISTKSTKKSVSLQWSLMHNCDGYIIYRKIGENGKYKSLKTIKGEGNINFTNKKLSKNKTYYYKVRAYRKVNGKRIYSQYSEEYCFQT